MPAATRSLPEFAVEMASLLNSCPRRYWWQTTLRRLTVGRSSPEPVMVMMQSVAIDERDWPALAHRATTALGL